MSATQAQVAFAAEFVLFLAALGGTSVLLLRPSLLVDGRLGRSAVAAGFVGIGAAAFLHGSLLQPDARAAAVLVPRVVGIALLVAGTYRRPFTLVVPGLLALAEVLTDTPSDVVLANWLLKLPNWPLPWP